MSATNSTTHYNLPVFLGSDKPAWLVDWNGAMSAIDSAIYEAKQTADSAASAVSTVSADLSTLSSTVSSLGSNVSSISTSLTSLIGTVNTITSLIGNGEPTTTDKTIIGAINEINAKIPEPGNIDADDVTYDNTDSGLTAVNVQAAIDELAGASPISGFAAEFKKQYAGKKILVLGDSLSVDNITWTKPFSDLCTECGVDFTNVSHNGRTSAQILTDLASITTPYDACILFIGLNDSSQGVNVGNYQIADTFSKNIKDILDTLHTLNSDMQIYVMSVTFSTSLTWGKNSNTFGYSAALKAMSDLCGAAFKNISHIVNAATSGYSAMTQDGNHFVEAFSKTTLFNAILQKILSPVSDEYREFVLLNSSDVTPAANVSFNKISGSWDVGKRFDLIANIAISASTSGTILTLPKQITYGSDVFPVTIMNTSDGSIVLGLFTDNTITTGSHTLTAGNYLVKAEGISFTSNMIALS